MIKDINNIDSRLLEEDDRIVSFLKGEMSEEEEKKFMKDLDDNPDLKEKAIVTARLVKGLKQVGEQQDREALNVLLASSDESVKAAAAAAVRLVNASTASEQRPTGTYYRRVEPEKETKNMSIRRLSAWMSVAASILFVCWLGFEYYGYRTTTGLGKEYGDVFSSSMIVRGAETPSQAASKLNGLFANVKDNKNMDETINELTLLWELSQMETLNDYTDYSAEIGWNLAIAYLKDNNKKEAKKILEKLIATTEQGSAISNKSKELLNKL